MGKNLGYFVLVVSAVTLGINVYRLYTQRRMIKAVCTKLNIEC